MSSVKYSRLPKEDEPERSMFDFTSAFDYGPKNPSERKYNANYNFNSAFKYTDVSGSSSNYVSVNMGAGNDDPHNPVEKASTFLVVTTCVLTFFSYVLFALTAPISYCLFVKKLGEFDRLVVFRLGKMLGVKGPGRVVVFPWMDRTKQVDVRAAAFSVPPQQFITGDGGIVEMGADVQYGIVDVVTMIREVADHQEILRSLSKTLLIKVLVKKTVPQIQKDKRQWSQVIQDDLNAQVRKWGIDVRLVALSEIKILKQPDDSNNSAMSTILKGIGMKGESKYPTPSEFVRASHGLEAGVDPNDINNPFSGLGATVTPAAAEMNLMDMMSSGNFPTGSSHVQLGPGIISPSGSGGAASGQAPIYDWGRCLELIIASEFSGALEDEAFGVYKLEITDTEQGRENYIIQLSLHERHVFRAGSDAAPAGLNPDVSVTISSPDLAQVLEGSLAPLQAYLTGRISATGDVRKLMLFDKLSKRKHKPGTMFNI